jgi:hypothetical protein
MKKATTFIFIIISLLLIFNNPSCKDKETKPNSNEKYYEHNEDTVNLWHLTFYFSDSLGNNLIPRDLPDTPFLNPKDYFVVSDSASVWFHFKYFKFPNDSLGYFFRFHESLYLIRSSSQYQIDSTYKVKVCFANECDTVISRIYSFEEKTKHYSNTGKNLNSTKWVLWNGDTIFTNSPAPIPIVIK